MTDQQLIGELTDTTELLVYLVDRKPHIVPPPAPVDHPDGIIFHIVEQNRRFEYIWDAEARVYEFGADFARLIGHPKERLEYALGGRKLSPLVRICDTRLTGGQTIDVRCVTED